MKKNKLNILKFGYSPWEFPINWFRNIAQFFKNLKYAYQRIVYGYCEADTWNLDLYYIELFYNTLNYLAENSHGYPGCFESFEEWQKYLRDTAQHFYNADDEHDDVKINQEIEMYFDKMESLTGNDREIARNLWLKKEDEAAEYREKEKDKGLNMMKKYFFSLWD